MTKFVRAKDPVSGHEFTTNETHAESAGLQVLDKDAVDANGQPLPPKHNVDKAGKPVTKES